MNGKGHLWIRTAQEGDRVLVEITDDGSGIPSEIQPRILISSLRESQAKGLGLDIVHRIVEGQQRSANPNLEKPASKFGFQLTLQRADLKCFELIGVTLMLKFSSQPEDIV